MFYAMGKIQVRNLCVRDFLLYQRDKKIPQFKVRYTWNERDTETLIKDINDAVGEVSYSIGIAVYVRGECIDGLGRLISLSLISKALGMYYPELERRWTARELKALKANYQAVKRALSFSDQDRFPSFFSECTYITLVEIEEMRDSFSFFDSGTERGVSLDPADLLKAYHLCSMRECNEGEKLSVISEWESIGKDRLSSLFSIWHPLLYWSKGIPAPPLSFQSLSAFEGIDENLDYPFAKALKNASPSITSCILNGKSFFDKCFHYHRMREELESVISISFPSLSVMISPDSPSDISCYELFESLSLLMFDRFGREAMKTSLPVIFRFAFSLRLEDSSVPWDKINRHVLSSSSILPAILYSMSPYDVYSYDFRKELCDMRNVAFHEKGPVRLIDWDDDFERWLK